MKLILRLVGGLILFVVIAAVSLLLLPAERFARIATDQISAVTGRQVDIAGDVSFTLWPVLGLEVAGLTVAGPDWSDKGPMLRADRASFGLEATRLLRGEIAVTHLKAERPALILEQKADGRASWLLGSEALAPGSTMAPSTEGETPDASAPTETSTGAPAVSPDFSIAKVDITDATVAFYDEGSASQRLSGLDAILRWGEPAGAMQIDATFQPAGQPVEVAATLDDFDGFLRGAVSPLSARLSTEAGTLSFSGRVATTGAVAGTLSLQTDATSRFLAALAVPGVDLPPKLGRRMDLTTELTFTPNLKLALRDINLGLEGNSLRGGADIVLSDPPEVNAQFDVGFLDLRGAFDAEGVEAPADPANEQGATVPSTQADASRSTAQTARSGWSSTPIDATSLAAFNGEIALRATEIDLGTLQFGPTRAIVRNDRARMVIDLRDVAAYGGAVTGEFVVNNRSGLSVGGRMQARNVQMQPLMVDAVDFGRVTGAADLSVSFLGAGPSVREIMNSLSGEGKLAVDQGTLLGINLDRLMRGDPTASGTTIFDSLTATWNIVGGVLQNDDLLLQLRNYEARGQGVVGLGAQTLDYTVTPIALRANSGNGLAIPVHFVGPWSDVSIRPDLEAALDLRIDQEVDKITDEVKAKADAEIDKITDEAKAKADREIDNLETDVKEKLVEELGITASEGQSSEDALKNEVEQRLLRKLFD